MRNLLSQVLRNAQPFVAAMVRTILAQPSTEEMAAQPDRVIGQLAESFPQVPALLEETAPT